MAESEITELPKGIGISENGRTTATTLPIETGDEMTTRLASCPVHTLLNNVHLHRVRTVFQLIAPDQEGAAGACTPMAIDDARRTPDDPTVRENTDVPVRLEWDDCAELGMWPDRSD